MHCRKNSSPVSENATNGGLTLKALDNLGNEYPIRQEGDLFVIDKTLLSPEAEFVEILCPQFDAKVNDEGYYVISDFFKKGSHICLFNKKEDREVVSKQDLMPIFGVKKRDMSVLGIAEGMKQSFFLRFGVSGGNYSLTLRFEITKMGLYEDISFRLIELHKNAEYCDMAIKYRELQLEKGVVLPLSERVKSNKQLRYAVEAPEIRIRLGWKPAPPTVLEQTVENEPPMYTACTFDRVKDLIDELLRQGVDKAQLCLVGWNTSGHDGRYPQLFPVEERLGGDEKLRELVAYAKAKGFQIVCHTNSTDCYSIADTFSEDIVAKTPTGELSINETGWSGGRMYNLCPQKALEYAEENLPQVAELGFKGIHYIDVMSVVPLRECYDKNHPCTKEQTLSNYNKIMEMSHSLFGGFASEGAFDFVAKYLDYAFYVCWPDLEDSLSDFEIPLWQIVYHGIILSNPSTATVNYTIKDKYSKNCFYEFGGRPSFYIYSRFMNSNGHADWLCKEDLTCKKQEELEFTVSKIKEAYDDYKDKYRLQYRFITSHRKIGENKFETVYDDGTKITTER